MTDTFERLPPDPAFKLDDAQLLSLLAQYLEDAHCREVDLTSGVLLPSIRVLHAQLLPKIKRILDGEDPSKVFRTKPRGRPVSAASKFYYNVLAGYIELRRSESKTDSEARFDAANVLGLTTANELEALRAASDKEDHAIVFRGRAFERFSAMAAKSPEDCLREAYAAHMAATVQTTEAVSRPE